MSDFERRLYLYISGDRRNYGTRLDVLRHQQLHSTWRENSAAFSTLRISCQPFFKPRYEFGKCRAKRVADAPQLNYVKPAVPLFKFTDKRLALSGITQIELAKRLGKDLSDIKRKLRIFLNSAKRPGHIAGDDMAKNHEQTNYANQ